MNTENSFFCFNRKSSFIAFRKAIFALTLILFSSISSAQISELGVSLGFTGYKGELRETMFSTSQVHPAFGIFWRRNTNAFWAFRFNFLKGNVSGSDKNSSSEFNKIRNLSFSSPIYELAYMMDFNFFPFEKFGTSYWGTPYVTAGIGLFHFNPSTNVNGQSMKLQTIQTEAKGYSLVSSALIMGTGMKFKVKEWVFAAELSARKTSTDYLDDVSSKYVAASSLYAKPFYNPTIDSTFTAAPGRQRGNSKDKDWYFFVGITISHHLGNIRKKECERLMKNS